MKLDLLKHLASLLPLLALVAGIATGTQDVFAQETSEQKARSSGEVSATMVDGIIKIKLGDGEVIEIDPADHGRGNAVIVQEHSSSDGEETTNRRRALLVGPDGSQRVLFDDDIPGMTFSWSGKPGVALPSPVLPAEGMGEMVLSFIANDFAVGIRCEDVDGVVKSHLGIGNGLVVEQVFDDSSAREAGIQQFDILMSASGEELNDVSDLVAVIQAAGENDSKVEFRLLRAGEEMELAVMPRDRRAASVAVPGVIEQAAIDSLSLQGLQVIGVDGTKGLDIERALPGLIQGQAIVTGDQDLAEEIAELRKMIEQLREEIRNK